MSPRRLIVAVAAAGLIATPAPAAANGDPASDVLLQQDVFFPYDPPTSNGVARALLELTDRTRKAGWPIKVAVIATPNDLGAVSRLFTNTQGYADLLASEIGNPRLLVVTPLGFGGQQLGEGVDRALQGLDPVEGGGDALARQALTAVARLAEEDGHGVATPKIDKSAAGRRPYRETVVSHRGSEAPVAESPGSSGPSGGDGTPWWLYAGPAVLAIILLVLVNIRSRRAEAATRAGETGEVG